MGEHYRVRWLFPAERPADEDRPACGAGHHLSRRGWRLPVGFTYREGLELITAAPPIARDSESGRDHDCASPPSWTFTDLQRRNASGAPTAGKLVPSAPSPAPMHPDASPFLRAHVVGHQVWVTRQHGDVLGPGGAYPAQSETDDGMTRWVADDEELPGTAGVLRYVFGITAAPAERSWTVLPADTVSFWLKPLGCFDRNPALDVAPAVAAGCRCEAGMPAGDHG